MQASWNDRDRGREAGGTEQPDGTAAGGLSRRTLIRRAAAAGAAAWVAPVIIDSLASPAAAGSQPCVKYWAKLQPNGTCYYANPACGYTVDATSRYVCHNPPGYNHPPGYPALLPGFVTYATNTNYYEITLQGDCKFSTETSWQVVGNYNFNCVELTGSAGAIPPDGTYTGNGYYKLGSNKAWIKKSHNFPDDGNGNIDFSYLYVQFCCGS